MDDQPTRQAPRAMTEALDASTHDIAAGRVRDAASVQREARRMLETFEKARSGGSAAPAGKGGTHAKTV